MATKTLTEQAARIERRIVVAQILMLRDAGLLYATKDRTPEATFDLALKSFPGTATLMHITLGGQESGHEWYACDTCTEVRLTAVKASRCKMTPGCRGRMVRLAPRPRGYPRRPRAKAVTTHPPGT